VTFYRQNIFRDLQALLKLLKSITEYNFTVGTVVKDATEKLSACQRCVCSEVSTALTVHRKKVNLFWDVWQDPEK